MTLYMCSVMPIPGICSRKSIFTILGQLFETFLFYKNYK